MEFASEFFGDSAIRSLKVILSPLGVCLGLSPVIKSFSLDDDSALWSNMSSKLSRFSSFARFYLLSLRLKGLVFIDLPVIAPAVGDSALSSLSAFNLKFRFK